MPRGQTLANSRRRFCRPKSVIWSEVRPRFVPMSLGHHEVAGCQTQGGNLANSNGGILLFR